MVRVFNEVLNQSRGGSVLLCRASIIIALAFRSLACMTWFTLWRSGHSPTVPRGVLIDDLDRVLTAIRKSLR